MKAVNILPGIVNIFLLIEIYVRSFQSVRENGITDKTVLLPLVFFFLLLIINCILLFIFIY